MDQKIKIKEKQTTKAHIKNFILGGVTCSFLIILLYFDVVFFIIKYYTSFQYGFYMYWFMEDEIETIHIDIYLFNITNADAFMSGDDAKLKVEEVGPFSYREVRTHENMTYDFENQRLHYSPRLQLHFMPDKSIGYPEDFNVVMPNCLTLGVASIISNMPSWTRLMFNMLASSKNAKPIVKVDAHTFLWGIKEPFLSALHSIVPGLVEYDKFGVLDRVYDPDNPLTLDIAIDDDEKFMVKKWYGHGGKKLNLENEEGSVVNSFEGLGFPAGLTKDFDYKYALQYGVCKLLDVEYNHTKPMYYGGEGLVYVVSDEFFNTDSNDTFEGLLDVSDCYYGSPVALSKAHFLGVDPKAYERIEGITPNASEISWITLEPQVGIQVESESYFQVNLVLNDLSYNYQTRDFSNMVLPIFYAKCVQPPLPKGLEISLILIYKIAPYLIPLIEVLLLLLTTLYWARVIVPVYQKWFKKSLNVTFPLISENQQPFLKENYETVVA